MSLQKRVGTIQEANALPASQIQTAVADVNRESQTFIEGWRAIEAKDVSELNRQLKAAGFPILKINSAP